MDKWASAKSFGFLRKSVVSCGFLWKSAPPKCCNFQERRKSAKIRENLRRKKLRIWLRLSLLVCPFQFLPSRGPGKYTLQVSLKIASRLFLLSKVCRLLSLFALQRHVQELQKLTCGPQKPQKLAEMKLQIFSHKTWSEKLGGILGEELWVVLYSK